MEANGVAYPHLIRDNWEQEQIVAEDADEVVLAGHNDRRHVLSLAILVDLFHEEVAHIAARESSPVLLNDDLAVPPDHQQLRRQFRPSTRAHAAIETYPVVVMMKSDWIISAVRFFLYLSMQDRRATSNGDADLSVLSSFSALVDCQAFPFFWNDAFS
jgi:hypothetical protein